MLAAVGSYALDQRMLDVWIMLVFTVLGFVFRRYGFAAAPIIMGLILGELVENSLKQSLLIFELDWFKFFERPIVVVFFVLTLAGLLGPRIVGAIYRRLNRRRHTR